MRSLAVQSSPLTALVMAITIGTMACSETPSSLSHESLHQSEQAAAKMVAAVSVSASTADLLKAVHAATARYHSTVQATKAGYEVSSPCVSHPTLGGMGFHWVNNALVDPVFDPLQPEALLYAPNEHGKLKLVAVEYIVINVGQPAPKFGDQPFNVGGTPVPVRHWSLHAWVHRDNPNGVFTSFNPTVVCPG